MQRQDTLDRFDLQDDLLRNDDIGDIGAVQADVIVDDRKRRLALERDGRLFELVAETRLVDRFQLWSDPLN